MCLFGAIETATILVLCVANAVSLISLLDSEGDVVSKGESVVVVESDKADMDVETFYDGILAAIVVQEGEVIPQNFLLLPFHL